MKILFTLFFAVLAMGAKCQDESYHICMQTENGKISFELYNDGYPDKAAYVRYKGKNEKILLKYVKENFVCDSCAHPTVETYYNEMIDGKLNGTYVVSYSANYYEITYTSKQNKKFKFTGRAGSEQCFL